MSEARLGIGKKIAGHHVRRCLGSLQEGLLAGLALNALGLLILWDNPSVSNSPGYLQVEATVEED